MGTVINTGTVATMNRDEIQNAILAAMGVFGPHDIARQEYKAKMERARDLSISAAEQTLSELAELAYKHAWSISEAQKAAKKAAELYEAGGNSSEAKARRKSSAATFKSRLLLVLDKQVRPHVREYFRLCNEAWKAEDALISDKENTTPTPIHECWPRANHVAIAAFRARSSNPKTSIAGVHLHGVADVAAFAERTLAARTVDYEAAHLRLGRMIDDLKAFNNMLPTPLLTVCIDAMGKIEVETLKEAANTLLSTVRVPTGADEPDADEPDADEPADEPATVDSANAAITANYDELIQPEPPRVAA
jgi:hypothetical protein